MPPVTGIFLLAELVGPAAEWIAGIQRRFDPKLAAMGVPHVTMAGSSGMGPIAADTTPAELAAALAPVAAATAPLRLAFGRPQLFLQTQIVSLPLDPHGPLRALHERVKTSGLRYARPRFAFSPHATLSFYPTLTPASRRELLALRLDEPAEIVALRAYRHRDPLPATLVWEAALAGAV